MRQRRSHIFAKAKDGWYVEPQWVSQRLFAVETFPDPIYDPACGWGTILRAARAAGHRVVGSDIINRGRHGLGGNFHRRDFLTRLGPIHGSVICNPPFDLIQEFFKYALELGAHKVAMIMLVRRLNAAHWLRALPLRRIWLLSPRPSMPPGEWIAAGNKPGGGTQDFCWLVGDADYRGVTQIDWLHRDEGVNG